MQTVAGSKTAVSSETLCALAISIADASYTITVGAAKTPFSAAFARPASVSTSTISPGITLFAKYSFTGGQFGQVLRA